MTEKEIPTHPLDEKATIRAWDIPMYRLKVGAAMKCDNKIGIVTYGGLGDVLCTEPTVRFITEFLQSRLEIKEVMVVTKYPELFKHLDVVISTQAVEFLNSHTWLYSGVPDSNAQNFFFTHNSMNPVNYPAQSVLQRELPLKYKTIKTTLEPFDFPLTPEHVVIHAGNHWQTKSFPKAYWDSIIGKLIRKSYTPVLIGGAVSNDPDKQGTVDVDTTGCVDLRTKLSIAQSAWLLNQSNIVLTNDSFPLHLATTGKAHIGFFATAKEDEWLYHWRETDENKIGFGWRMKNLALGGAYERVLRPTAGGRSLMTCTPEELKSWLPHTDVVIKWVEKTFNNEKYTEVTDLVDYDRTTN